MHLCIDRDRARRDTNIYVMCCRSGIHLNKRECSRLCVRVCTCTCTRILVQGAMHGLVGWVRTKKKTKKKTPQNPRIDKPMKALNKKEKKTPLLSEKIRWHMMWCMHLRRIFFFPFPFLALPHYVTRIPPKWRSHYNNDTSNYIHTCECTMTEHTHLK